MQVQSPQKVLSCETTPPIYMSVARAAGDGTALARGPLRAERLPRAVPGRAAGRQDGLPAQHTRQCAPAPRRLVLRRLCTCPRRWCAPSHLGMKCHLPLLRQAMGMVKPEVLVPEGTQHFEAKEGCAAWSPGWPQRLLLQILLHKPLKKALRAVCRDAGCSCLLRVSCSMCAVLPSAAHVLT